MITAVSYTHLDVYKRQDQIILVGLTDISCSERIDETVALLASESVSYTHLDVYKRQQPRSREI